MGRRGSSWEGNEAKSKVVSKVVVDRREQYFKGTDEKSERFHSP
jgi:hypothetical protein